MNALEPLEQLVRVLEVFSNILIELALPSAIFLISLLTYAIVRYFHNTITTITGLPPNNSFYQQANIFISGFEVVLVLLLLLGSVLALRHLKELPF